MIVERLLKVANCRKCNICKSFSKGIMMIRLKYLSQWKLVVSAPMLLFVSIFGNTDTVKMSRSNICHDVSSPFYERTNIFTSFSTVGECLKAGGRLPKGHVPAVSMEIAPQPAPDPKASLSNDSSPERGNTTNDSFNKAKRILERKVYFDHRQTIYCGASFDERKNVLAPTGFISSKYQNRARRIEWEHVVPAENFGRTFSEWRDGHPDCVDSKGKNFRGRKCAEKVNMEYRHMQSDMHNLFPAIGAVNAMRSNYNFVLLPPSAASDFGSCAMKIEGSKAEPPVEARGRIARSYLYMELAYPRYKMSKQQRQLMEAWDKQHPVSQWECLRTQRISNLQGNINTVVSHQCSSAKATGN